MTEQFLRNAMEAHGDAVYRLALCQTQSPPDAEDVYQDVFLRLLDQPPRQWDGEHLKAWLIRAVLNRCADLGRFRLRRQTIRLEEVSEAAAPADEAAELWEAVGRLPEKFRTVVHLYYAEGYQTDEIAALLGCPAATVRTRLRRASVDVLDGASLTVTAAFEDGTEQTEVYRLSAGKLQAAWNDDGTQALLPGLAGDDGACFYGVYVTSESGSRWFQWPVQGADTVSMSNPFGGRWSAGGGTRILHEGMDIPGERGTPVTAAAGGTVLETGFDENRGNYVVLDHGGGLETVYAQCQSVLVEEGRQVEAGEQIAALGSTGRSTGPHLCFQVWQDGKAQDPLSYFDSGVRDTLEAA